MTDEVGCISDGRPKQEDQKIRKLLGCRTGLGWGGPPMYISPMCSPAQALQLLPAPWPELISGLAAVRGDVHLAGGFVAFVMGFTNTFNDFDIFMSEKSFMMLANYVTQKCPRIEYARQKICADEEIYPTRDFVVYNFITNSAYDWKHPIQVK